MSKVKVTIDKRTIKVDGTSPIKFRISLTHKTSFYISTGISVKPEQFKKDGGKDGTSWVVLHVSRSRYNNYIAKLLVIANETLLDMVASCSIASMQTKDIKSKLVSAMFGEEPIGEGSVQEERILLSDVYDRFLALKHGSTKELHKYTIVKLRELVNDYDTIAIDDINKNWLKQLHDKITSRNKINTSAAYLRNLKAVFNYAIDEELTTNYPFRKYKIITEETQKRSLTPQQLKTFITYHPDQYRLPVKEYFLLILYLIGINVADIIKAEKKDLVNGRLVYRRAKTRKLYSIKIEPEALSLMEKHAGAKYLFDIIEKKKDRNDVNVYFNTSLKVICEGIRQSLDPNFPDISVYWARHTWATIAHKIGISKDVVSMSLGHSQGSRITDIYIDYDNEKVDVANRKVIDFINSI